jgi:hypothetical protein
MAFMADVLNFETRSISTLQDMVYIPSFHGYELGREEFATPSGGKEETRPGNRPETRFRCPQNLFDPILRRFAERQPGVTLRQIINSP